MNFLFNLKLLWWAFRCQDKLNAYLLYKDAQNIYYKKLKEHKNSQKAYRDYCLKRCQYDATCQ